MDDGSTVESSCVLVSDGFPTRARRYIQNTPRYIEIHQDTVHVLRDVFVVCMNDKYVIRLGAEPHRFRYRGFLKNAYYILRNTV